MSELEKHLSKKPPEVLFHYTNQSGLLGIIDTFEIWATKILYLNDTTELLLAFEMAKEELDKRRLDSGDPDKYRKVEILQHKIDSWKSINLFVCSFSEDGDSLSQWRAYGNSTSSFSIGFSSAHLKQMALNNEFVLAKCIYDEKSQRDLITDLVVRALRKDFALNPNRLFDLVDPEPDKIAEECVAELARLAPILKHKSFSEEKEWRLISGLTSHEHPLFSFRQGASMIAPYFRFPLREGNDLPKIVKLVVGPTPHEILAAESADMLLRKKGLDIEVVVSTIPLRNY